jgi:hypothetical protein
VEAHRVRISANVNDPGYVEFLHAKDRGEIVRIFLDGDQIRPDVVVTADEEHGFIIVHELDDGGRKIVQLGTCRTKMMTGRVVIRRSVRA